MNHFLRESLKRHIRCRQKTTDYMKVNPVTADTVHSIKRRNPAGFLLPGRADYGMLNNRKQN